jgi:type 1 glutamine amidotransferase
LVNAPRLLLLVGGAWHDFDGFARSVKPGFESSGYELRVSYDFGALRQLDLGEFSLVMLNTCLDGSVTLRPSPPEVHALAEWVGAGGSLLGMHGATVVPPETPELAQLLGGKFVSHPPRCVFGVRKTAREHPITAGIEPFLVDDELYLHDCADDLTVLLRSDPGDHPLCWTRRQGRGKVAYLALGHDAAVWQLPGFTELVRQAVAWLLESRFT